MDQIRSVRRLIDLIVDFSSLPTGAASSESGHVVTPRVASVLQTLSPPSITLNVTPHTYGAVGAKQLLLFFGNNVACFAGVVTLLESLRQETM